MDTNATKAIGIVIIFALGIVLGLALNQWGWKKKAVEQGHAVFIKGDAYTSAFRWLPPCNQGGENQNAKDS